MTATCPDCGDDLHDGPRYCYGCGWTSATPREAEPTGPAWRAYEEYGPAQGAPILFTCGHPVADYIDPDTGGCKACALGGAEPAGRAEVLGADGQISRSAVIHLVDPEAGYSYCLEPVTLVDVDADADVRPICQTCHRGAMRRVRHVAAAQAAALGDGEGLEVKAAETLRAERDALVDRVRKRHPRGDEEPGPLAAGRWCPGCAGDRSDDGMGACAERRALLTNPGDPS